MNNWTTKTMTFGACTINVHRPELTSAERAKREQVARDTVGRVLRDYVRRKETKA